MSTRLKLSLGVLAASLIIYWVFLYQEPRWTLFYYPTECISCTNQVVRQDVYKSREQCVIGGRTLVNLNPEGEDSFECGKSCRLSEPSDGLALYECVETVDQ